MRSATAPLPSDTSSKPASADPGAASAALGPAGRSPSDRPRGAPSYAGAAPDTPGFGVYIHWPFCRSKCPYCDFNSHVMGAVDQARWRRALLAELDHALDRGAGETVTSIFFGGGTPSLMDPATAAALITRIRARRPVVADLEITLEANPTSVESGQFAAFAAAGINRVSLGVQALDDAALRFLGRGHSAAEALVAIEIAQRQFQRFSFDLIYARPGQSRVAWRAELARALDHANDHLSLYQLAIEPGTAFDPAHRRGDFVLPDDDFAGALYEETQEIMAAAGLPAYEISNHARPGAQCRHNLIYWRAEPYIGIGPGAHGRVDIDGVRRATRVARAPETWLKRVEAAGHGTDDDIVIAPEDRLTETLMMGLRINEGVTRSRFRCALGREIEDVLPMARLAPLIEAGWLEVDGTGLRATASGRQRLNSLLARILP